MAKANFTSTLVGKTPENVGDLMVLLEILRVAVNGIDNEQITDDAQIAWSKISTLAKVANADVAADAAIESSKIDFADGLPSLGTDSVPIAALIAGDYEGAAQNGSVTLPGLQGVANLSQLTLNETGRYLIWAIPSISRASTAQNPWDVRTRLYHGFTLLGYEQRSLWDAILGGNAQSVHTHIAVIDGTAGDTITIQGDSWQAATSKSEIYALRIA